MSAPYSRARDHFCHANLFHLVRVKCIRIERGRKRNCHKICHETTSIGNEICKCLRQLEPHTGLILNQTNFINIYHINVSHIFEEHTIKIVHKPLTETGTIRIKLGQRDNIVKTGTVPGKTARLECLIKYLSIRIIPMLFPFRNTLFRLYNKKLFSLFLCWTVYKLCFDTL